MDVLKSYTLLGKTLEIYAPPQTPPDQVARRAENVQIGAITLSASRVCAAAGEGVRISAEISGSEIAHIYAEALLCDMRSGHLYGPLWRQHIRSAEEKRVGGLTHPVWGGQVQAAYDYQPALRLLFSGGEISFAFLLPEAYPSAGAGTGWTQAGEHTSVVTGNTRRAVLTFDTQGALRRARAFKAGSSGQSPSALTLRRGDRFAPAVQILLHQTDGSWQSQQSHATPLTLQGADVHWEAHPLPEGEIYIGFAVRDYDDRWQRRYAPLLVTA